MRNHFSPLSGPHLPPYSQHASSHLPALFSLCSPVWIPHNIGGTVEAVCKSVSSWVWDHPPEPGKFIREHDLNKEQFSLSATVTASSSSVTGRPGHRLLHPCQDSGGLDLLQEPQLLQDLECQGCILPLRQHLRSLLPSSS